MRKQPSGRFGGSAMRALAWGAVAFSLLPWVISGIAICSTGFIGRLEDVSVEQCVFLLFGAGATIVMGLIASINAAKEDQATQNMATVAVVLATFSAVIAGALLIGVQ